MKVWKLLNNTSLLATLKEVDSDQPWFICKLIPSPEFDQHKAFFLDQAEQFSSGNVTDFNAFFAHIAQQGYSLIENENTSKRFIILFNQTSDLVSLRCTYTR